MAKPLRGSMSIFATEVFVSIFIIDKHRGYSLGGGHVRFANDLQQSLNLGLNEQVLRVFTQADRSLGLYTQQNRTVYGIVRGIVLFLRTSLGSRSGCPDLSVSSLAKFTAGTAMPSSMDQEKVNKVRESFSRAKTTRTNCPCLEPLDLSVGLLNLCESRSIVFIARFFDLMVELFFLTNTHGV